MKAPKGYMVFETFLIFQFLHPDAIYMQKNSSESTDTAKQQKTKTPPDLGGVLLVETTGLEPVTSCMSSKYSNQLSYASVPVYYTRRSRYCQ